ncbi:MAG: porin, partial [Betaproteobacteria bacterium]
ADGSFNRQRWKRRETALTYYESPRFGGFQVLGAFSAGGIAAADNGAFDGQNNTHPRLFSLAGIYQAGPLGIGLAYERHTDVGGVGGLPTAAAIPDLDDRAWGASVSYKFGPVEVGATYLDAKFETGVGAELKKKTATVGIDWAIAGPHSIEAQYAWVGDSKGNSTVGIGGRGGHAAPVQGGIGVGDTGGDGFSVAYRYRFSKRTSIKLGYIRIENDTNTNTYRIGNTASVVAGENQSAVAFHIRHRF